MDTGDIFIIGNLEAGDYTRQFVYICDFPLKEINKIVCVKVNSTSDTPRSANRRLWEFLPKDGIYTPFAKHENMSWCNTKREFFQHLFQIPEFVEGIIELQQLPPETKAQVMAQLQPGKVKDMMQSKVRDKALQDAFLIRNGEKPR